MSKPSYSKKNDSRTQKSPAVYVVKDDNQPNPSKYNSSKYAPGKDTELNVQQLDPEDGLMKLFIDSIKDLYWAETQLLKALPKMVKAAGSVELSEAISKHIKETQTHSQRLEDVFKLLGKEVQSKKCDAIEGLTKEGEALIEDTDNGSAARDIGIIMSSQKVEHYEIAAYTGLINLASRLGLLEIAEILSLTLSEEHEADNTLGSLAEKILSSISEE